MKSDQSTMEAIAARLDYELVRSSILHLQPAASSAAWLILVSLDLRSIPSMKTTLALICASLLASCATPEPQIVTSANPVTGSRSVAVANNYIAHTGGMPASHAFAAPLSVPNSETLRLPT